MKKIQFLQEEPFKRKSRGHFLSELVHTCTYPETISSNITTANCIGSGEIFEI